MYPKTLLFCLIDVLCCDLEYKTGNFLFGWLFKNEFKIHSNHAQCNCSGDGNYFGITIMYMFHNYNPSYTVNTLENSLLMIASSEGLCQFYSPYISHN